MADARARSIAAPGASCATRPAWPFGVGPRGVTVISGGPGTAKGYVALASSIAAARAGWGVLYVTGGMRPKALAERVLAHCGGAHPPAGWRILAPSLGFTVERLRNHIAGSERPLLVVLDSLQELAELGQCAPETYIRWARAVTREPAEVAALVIHEGAGRTFAWADRVLRMTSDRRRSRLKYIDVDGSDTVRLLLGPGTARLAFIGTVRAHDGGRIDA